MTAAGSPGDAEAGHRPPRGGPAPVDRAERGAFDALVQASLPAVRDSAQAWRTGLSGLLTLVTTAVILKGRDSVVDMAGPWRVAASVLVGAGLGAAILALWQALSAEVGTRPGAETLEGIHRRHTSVAAYQVALANQASRHLVRARRLGAAALALLLAGVLTTWWAPATPVEPAAHLAVRWGERVVCGSLRSADGATLRLDVEGSADPEVVPLAEVAGLAVVPTCP